jgi:hypothetical protein
MGVFEQAYLHGLCRQECDQASRGETGYTKRVVQISRSVGLRVVRTTIRDCGSATVRNRDIDLGSAGMMPQRKRSRARCGRRRQ